MIERVERIAPAGAIEQAERLDEPEDCPWCGDRLDAKGLCSRNCEGSRHARQDEAG